MLGFLHSPKDHSKGFIESTADAYDMDYSLVEYYYNCYGSTIEFYDALEEELKDRRNK